MITLTQSEVQELQNYCLEMPGKYGISIINFLNQKVAQAQIEQNEINNIDVNPDDIAPQQSTPVEEQPKSKKTVYKKNISRG